MARRYTEDEVRRIVDEAVAAAVAPLLKKIEKLGAAIEVLEAQISKLKKNSTNSSKPPSSDIVKPPKAGHKGKGKRRKGGQKGHPRHERKEFTAEQIDYYQYHELDLDPEEWEALEEWETLQQVDLKDSPIEVTEHRARLYRNRKTGQIVSAGIPKEVKAAGLVGPNLTALIAYLKGACHLSYSNLETMLEDVFGIDLCRGMLAKIVTGKVSAALAEPYQELLGALPSESYLGIDETGHKDDGKRQWTWCFRARSFILFHIADTRSADVLFAILGRAFDGVIGCDYFSSYRAFLGDSSATLQFCLAHLIRDVKFLAEQSDKVVRNWANKALKEFTELFKLIHKRDRLPTSTFQKQLMGVRDRLIKRFKTAPRRPGAIDLRERFRLYSAEFFTFVTVPGIEPTNNMTEQAIRYVVIDRRITQGTRGTRGQRWCERIWTTISTCQLQGQSVFRFLKRALRSYFNGEQAPSLQPMGP